MITIQFVAATAMSLFVFVMLANFVVDLYARGVVRAAVDEGARAGATIDASTADCDGARATCSTTCSAGEPAGQVARVVSRGRRHDAGAGHRRAARVDPRHPDWSFAVDGTVVKEHAP